MSKLKGHAKQDRLNMLRLRERVVTFSHPALATVCEPVQPGEDISFIRTMQSVCEAFEHGVGLAASQIGILKRVVFIRPPKQTPYFMVNPKIINVSDEKVVGEEGCLSYPGISGQIERHKFLVVEFFAPTDKDQKSLITKPIDGFEAVIVQHEFDHLMGICAIRRYWEASKK